MATVSIIDPAFANAEGRPVHAELGQHELSRRALLADEGDPEANEESGAFARAVELPTPSRRRSSLGHEESGAFARAVELPTPSRRRSSLGHEEGPPNRLTGLLGLVGCDLKGLPSR